MSDDDSDEIRRVDSTIILVARVFINLIIVASIVLGAFLVQHREEPLTKRLSWRLMTITLTGLSTLAVGVQLFHYSSEEEEWKCTALPFILGSGFILTFAPLIARSIRIHRILTSMQR